MWPGWWDIAAGGVVASVRRTTTLPAGSWPRRSASIDADIELVGAVASRTSTTASAELCRGYRVVHDGPFTFADGEVIEARLGRPLPSWTDARHASVRARQHHLLLPLLCADLSDST